ATDNCDTNVPVQFSEELIQGTCGFTLIRTWTATDDCGNMAIQSQRITVLDGFEVNLTVLPRSCSEGGSIQVMVTGGVDPVTYTWEDPSVPQEQSERFDLAPGSYGLTVTDAA